MTGNTSAAARLSRRTALGLLASTTLLPILPAGAETTPAAFPQRPITLIVPFSAGGPVDVLGRLLAHEYQARSGVTVIVENKTGGAGNIGIEAVRKAAPDGTTLLLIPAGNLTINPTLMSNLPFDVERDFAPVTMLASAPNVIVVAPQLGVKSIQELIAKAKSGRITYGSPGVGSQLHLAMELLKEKTGVDMIHVPYRGSSQALGDLLGGHIDVLATNLPAALSSIKANTVVALAMTTAARSPLVPDVPTLAEAGVAGIDVTSWYGMLAPKAIPTDVRDALFAVTKDVLTAPALQEKLLTQGLSVMIEGPDVFAARIKRETELWAGVIKSRHITIQ
ncbi:Bug family tripartite tricarboxylate transporter substrate binding protein [Pseudolabrys taiwanensis]|uniref:Bug family tripartite tricarboxylate transporter substrate binding protein n=1 Tax=Pseudolabrys taiwanensis TaxID=331696 RepID=UPI001AED0704|nr:tripartite tricarboxylate transporter substrate binding protein [Pseudolabrys taiwanensis]